MNASKRISISLALFAGTVLAPPLGAQKLDSKYREFPAIGAEFKPLKDFSDVPVSEGMGSQGIIAQMDAERGTFVPFEDGQRHEYRPSLKVVYYSPQGPTSEGGKEEEKKVEVRREAQDFVKAIYRGALRDDKLEAELSEVKASKKRVGERAEMVTKIKMNSGTDVEIVFDVYTFVLGLDKIVFVWDYPAESKTRKKWGPVVEKSMKSFRLTKDGASESDVSDVTSDSSYEDLLEYHRHDVEQTPGWRLVETPSKQYLIKTNEEDDKDIKEVILRLEASRQLYEKDFPPTEAITSVSVVRICATRGEFNTYGQTGGGVAGYFNPRSEELVLFFGEGSKSMTLSVMAHEGFHQYCHFLFGRAEAHRWFDEGHGDYYGAWKMKGKKLIQEEDMKEGLARIPEIKEMMRNGKIKRLSEHIRADHQTWQTQGPSNVSCYAQSFALIYFLREGANGNIPRKYWKKEWASIIPNYMEALNKGFQEAYEEVRKEAQEKLDALDELDPADVDEKLREEAQDRVDNPWKYARADKEKIWDAAMQASWGQVDEKDLEAHWLEYIQKVL
jgi:hypothetical protein